jgi:hypothetical protein
MTKMHKTRRNYLGLEDKGASAWTHGRSHDQDPEKRGVRDNNLTKWVFHFRIGFLMVFNVVFGGVLPKNEDMEPFFRPDIGRKLGCEPQLKCI